MVINLPVEQGRTSMKSVFQFFFHSNFNITRLRLTIYDLEKMISFVPAIIYSEVEGDFYPRQQLLPQRESRTLPDFSCSGGMRWSW